MKKEKSTSWGNVANWYDTHLNENPDTYQEKVIAPNLLRILNIKNGQKILDLACGQGYFSKKISDLGADVYGADISKELISIAKKRIENVKFFTTPAHKLGFSKGEFFDKAVIVLAIQNIENPDLVLKEVNRVLKKGGKFVLIINHPTFRIPGKSHWGFDQSQNTQYRRIDSYLSTSKSEILMNPGNKKSEVTISYHRSLQEFFKIFNKNNFAVTRIEEWISHKKSQQGPRQKAEDRARKEIPIFMMIECVKI